ncbi:MAG: DUF5666 domain-containing protein [Chloroflexota bacterium]
MNKSHRFLVTVLLIGAYLLSACSGAMPGTTPGQDDTSSGAQFTEVVFTGNVEAMDASQWTISGQVVSVEGASIDPAIKVGDIVKVEAKVAADGSVFALRIEVSRPDGADDNANDNMNGNANDNMNGNANDNMNDNANDDNANDNMNGNDNASDDDEQEVYGVVEALSANSITVNGMTYVITSLTEFKTIVAVGDYVKLHLMAGSDGSLIVREIEKKSPGDDDNDNANDNTGYDDDNGNSNSNSNYNSNSNSNDDDDDDNSNGNSNSNHNNNDNDDDDDNDNGNSNGDD